MDMLAAIRNRFSVRSYADRSIDPALLERLLSFAANAGHLSDLPPRVELISGVDAVKDVLTFFIGSYGLVLNAPHVLVGVLPEESERARVDLGYVLEQVVLEATRLGLGTCWITGTFDPERTADTIRLEAGEVAAGVCALGYPTDKWLGHLHSRIVRRLARGHKRKPLSELVFSERWGGSWSPQDADPTLVAILEHARLAPSAGNLQPWRFVVDDDRVTLAMVRRSPIDAGIVMSHVTLASAALERPGHWELRLRDNDLRERYDLPGKARPVGMFTYSDS
jgi:nitroreductase